MSTLTLRSPAKGAMTHVPKMRRVARGILGRDDLADDSVQEALISLYELRRPPGNLEAWLVRTVVHRSLTARRAHVRRTRNERLAAEALGAPRARSNPEQELCRQELSDRILGALYRLTGDQRQAFVLREICGFDYLRISTVQQVPVGTVRSRLNRAREALRDQLHPSASRGEGPSLPDRGGSSKVASDATPSS